MTAAAVGDPIAPWVTGATLHTDPRLAAIAIPTLDLAAQAATENLWALSGRQFSGLRTGDVLVLPPACGCDIGAAVGRSDMWSSQGGMVGWWPIGWIFGCSCRAEVTLPDRPVQTVTSVTIDGTVIPSSGYRLDDNATLVRKDGAYWPLVGSGLADLTTPRMHVVYEWGRVAPLGGVQAALVYATELALAIVGSGDCRLPDRVTSITRQDVITTFADPTVLLDHGLTGLSSVDAWLHSVNPRSQSGQRPRVLSPDLPRIRRTS